MPQLGPDITIWLSAFWRRRWLILAMIWILSLVGWAVVIWLPDRYEAMARVYVDTDTPMGPLLKNLAVENDTQRQVLVMQHTLLSRPNLQQVMVATDLAVKARTRQDQENLYTMLEKNTHIAAQGANLFSISYTGADPVLARDVVQSLITILVESNTGQSRTDIEKARAFIEKQIASYEDQLRKLEGRMAEFRSQHVGETSTNTLDYPSRLEAAHKSRLEAEVTYGESRNRTEQLRSQLRTIPQFNELESTPQVVLSGQPNPIQLRLLEAENTLATLRQRLTDKHPDVMAAKRIVDDLKTQIANNKNDESPNYKSHARVTNPVYEQVQLRLLDAEQASDLARQRLMQAEQEEKRLQALADSAPALDAQWSDLTREYGVLKKQYDELLARRESARLSQAVENTSNKIQFRVVEPPVVPLKPTGPNRPLFVLGVLGGATAFGLGLIALLHFLQQPLTSRQQLLAAFDIPVLGQITLVPTSGEKAKKRKNVILFAASTACLLLVFSGILTFAIQKSFGNDFRFPRSHAERQVKNVG